MVTAYYNDDSTEDVTADVTITGFDSSAATEEQTVTVTYHDKTAAFNVKILALEVIKIQVTTPPDKLEYFMGEKFDPSGIVVTASYNNATLSNITNDVVMSGFDSHKENDSLPVTVSYKNVSTTFTVKIKYSYALHDVVEVLPVRTDGTQGKNATYVLFGDYPQTVVPEDKVAELGLEESTVKVQSGAFEYVRGKDLNLYLKWKERGYALYESNECSLFYSDNTRVNIESENKYRWFKVEPIKWVVADNNYNGGKLLLAEKIIDIHMFQTFVDDLNLTADKASLFPNNYEKSEMRAYLNGLECKKYFYVQDMYHRNVFSEEPVYDYCENNKINSFLCKAFTPDAQTRIKETSVDNSAESTNCPNKAAVSDNIYVCNDTKDKIFLISKKELILLTGEGNKSDMYRSRKITDFVMANHCDPRMTGKLENDEYVGSYWLRSPCIYSGSLKDDEKKAFENVQVVYKSSVFCKGDGSHASPYSLTYEEIGVVPALAIEF